MFFPLFRRGDPHVVAVGVDQIGVDVVGQIDLRVLKLSPDGGIEHLFGHQVAEIVAHIGGDAPKTRVLLTADESVKGVAPGLIAAPGEEKADEPSEVVVELTLLGLIEEGLLGGRAVELVEGGGYGDVLQKHGHRALDLADHGVQGGILQGEDVDHHALGQVRVHVVQAGLVAVLVVDLCDQGGHLVAGGVGCHQLVFVAQLPIEDLHKAVEIVAGHDDVHIVVPGNEALVAHTAQGGAAVGHVADAVLFTHIRHVLDHPQHDLLQFADLLVRHMADVPHRRRVDHDASGGDQLFQFPKHKRCPFLSYKIAVAPRRAVVTPSLPVPVTAHIPSSKSPVPARTDWSGGCSGKRCPRQTRRRWPQWSPAAAARAPGWGTHGPP